MKKSILSLYVIAAIFITGCAKSAPERLISFCDVPFEAEIAVDTGTFQFSAKLMAKEIPDTDLPRDAELIFTLPASINGMRATRESGVLTLSLNGHSLKQNDAELFFSYVLPLLCKPDVKSVHTASLDGKKVSVITALADGKETELYFSESGEPLLCVSGAVKIYINSLKKG